MLTGDKGETAREIGVSCGLIPESKDEVAVSDTVGNNLASQQNIA